MGSVLGLPSLVGQLSVRDQVGHALRAALISGQMQPGEIYSAPALAVQFGVSPTPVREAMLDLVKEGFVSVVRNKGFLVRGLSEDELDDIMEMRRLLEVPAAVKVIGVATSEQIDDLRSLAQRIVETARDRDVLSHVELDRQFHLELLAIGGNEHLVSTVGNLRARSRLFGLQELADSGRLTASALEHGEMLDLILAKDDVELAKLVSRHIGHIRGAWVGRDEPAATRGNRAAR
jgi:DNA-binding GntR family transcriptional regulator